MASRSETTTLVTTALLASATTATALWFMTTLTRRWDDSDLDKENDGVAFRSGQVTPPIVDDTENNGHVGYYHQRLSMNAIRQRARNFFSLMKQRRTMRFFSSDPVPRDVIETIVATAGTAPSGAHKQPWAFVAVSDAKIKKKIRELVEHEETINYQQRMRKSWVADVESMVSQVHKNGNNNYKTDQDAVQKPYLTEAPWLIVVFKQPHGIDPETKQRIDHYYVNESIGIACGILISAIHNANLATLTSTPMGAEKGIRQLLGRPDHEKVVLLMPVGFPAKNATVPYRKEERKPIDQVLVCKC